MRDKRKSTKRVAEPRGVEYAASLVESSQEGAAPQEPTPKRLLVRDLGWSREQALETYYRLQSFSDDWDAPGMDAYDAL